MYLCLPEKICGSKRQAFAYIQERLNSRVNSWSAKLLSKGGKEVLLKSVAQDLPTYVMSCFLLPQDIIRKLTSSISKFWWSSKQTSRGLHWIAWHKICKPKDKGGLGFRDFKNFNHALLAKQLWRILHHPTSLLARVLEGRYFRATDPIMVSKANSPSYVWRSLMAAKPLLQAGLRRTIGSGANTKVWSANWLPTLPPRPPLCIRPSFNPDLKVAELLLPHSQTWNLDSLRSLFATEDISLICSIKPRPTSQNDDYCWSHTNNGIYSVKTGYDLAMEMQDLSEETTYTEPSTTQLQAKVWKIKAPSKIKHFVWQALSNCVPVCDQLANRHCGRDRSCARCGAETETINHMLFGCPLAVQTWALADVPFTLGIFPCTSTYSNIDHLLWRITEQGVPESLTFTVPWILWYL